MVLTRINLKLIKCDFWLDFILFHFFFKENNIKKNVFLYGILSALLKKFQRYDPWKIQKEKKRKEKILKKKTSLSSAETWITFLVRKTLKFGFLYFYKSCRELNFLSKKINPELIEILSSKLWPKYETGAEDNINSAFSSIFSQNSKWVQRQLCSSLSNRLILSLYFRRNIFEK